MRQTIFGLFFGTLTFFSFYRVSLPDHWSQVVSRDFETLLALRCWEREGYAGLNFLSVPQGYSSIVRLFDEPELNHHAHGPRVNTGGDSFYRRANTHLLSWFAFPYIILKKFGFEEKFYYQALAAIISLIALVLLYRWAVLVFPAGLAVLFTIAYGIGDSFQGYSDSLTSMPFDDLSRSAYLYFFAKHWSRPRSTPLWIPCLLAGLCAATGVESLLLLFTWTWVALFQKERAWWKLFLIVGAALVPLFLQLVQNSFYLGLREALADWIGVVSQLSASPHRFIELFSNTVNMPLLIAIVLTMIALYLNWRVQNFGWNLIAFGLGGSLLGFLFPHAADSDLLMRNLGYFISLLYAGLTWGVYRALSPKLQAMKVTFLVVTSVILVLVFILTGGLRVGLERWKRSLDISPSVVVEPAVANLLERVHQKIPGDKVYFAVGDRLPIIKSEDGRLRVPPAIEYYARATVLAFSSPETLVRDLRAIWKKQRRLFGAIALVPEQNNEAFLRFLTKENIRHRMLLWQSNLLAIRLDRGIHGH